MLAAVFASMPAAHAADIVGTITFKGTPPPEHTNNLIMDDPTCGKMYSTPPTTHFYVVGKDGGFADVVVSLKDADGKDITGKSTGADAPSALLDQKGCLYTPQILAIQTGQKLLVRNSDQCVHNVHCVPTAPGDVERNEAQMPGGPDLTFTFPKPEMFLKFECDVHPWMFAWVSVFDNPYFDISDTEGKFTIKNVPPGKYTIVAAHYKAGTQTQVVEVADKNVTANFTFEAK